MLSDQIQFIMSTGTGKVRILRMKGFKDYYIFQLLIYGRPFGENEFKAIAP